MQGLSVQPLPSLLQREVWKVQEEMETALRGTFYHSEDGAAPTCLAVQWARGGVWTLAVLGLPAVEVRAGEWTTLGPECGEWCGLAGWRLCVDTTTVNLQQRRVSFTGTCCSSPGRQEMELEIDVCFTESGLSVDCLITGSEGRKRTGRMFQRSLHPVYWEYSFLSFFSSSEEEPSLGSVCTRPRHGTP